MRYVSQVRNLRHVSQVSKEKQARNLRYMSQASKEKQAHNLRYVSQASKEKQAHNLRYVSQANKERGARRARYISYSEKRPREKDIVCICMNADLLCKVGCHSSTLQLRQRAYYSDTKSRKAVVLIRRASRCLQKKAKRARYSLHMHECRSTMQRRMSFFNITNATACLLQRHEVQKGCCADTSCFTVHAKESQARDS